MSEELIKPIAFDEVREAVKLYLEEPSSEDPYSLVTDYFNQQGGLRGWTLDASAQAVELLMLGRERCRNLSPANLEPQYGSIGTIVMGLPHFYPLHLTILSWLVNGRIESARDLDPAIRQRIAYDLLNQAKEYDVYGCDIHRNIGYVRSRLFEQPAIPPQVIADTQRPQSWLSRILPFNRK